MKTKFTLLKQIGMMVLLGMAVISLSACVAAAVTGAAAAGGAGAAYYMGTLKVDMQEKPSKLAVATRNAFQALSIKVEEFRATEVDALITGHTADKKVTVKIHRETELVSELSIRVGNFGDESMSNLIYEEIKRQLRGGTSSSSVTTYAVPMETTPSLAPTHTPAPPSLEPASTSNTPSHSTPSPSTGTPMAY